MISPENQEHAARTLCDREGLAVVEVVHDLDLSGRDFAKRKVDYIIRGVEDGRWDVVVMWKWSRFGRNLMGSLINLQRVNDAGGKNRAATEDFDEATTMGRFTRDQLLLIAELQSNQIGDTWREAHARRHRLGLPHTSYPRFGYIYDREAKQYTVDPVEGPILAELYRRFVEGHSQRGLSDWLNDQAIATKRGSRWSAASLISMLENGFGAGYYGKGFQRSGIYAEVVRGAHEPVINEDIWTRFIGMRMNRNRQRRNNKAAYSISGLVVCAHCGGKMRSRSLYQERGYVFECGRHADYKDACPGAYANRKQLERVVEEWLRDNLVQSKEDVLQAQLDAASTRGQLRTERHRTNTRIAEIKRQRTRLVELYTAELIDQTEFAARRKPLDDELAALEASSQQQNAAVDALAGGRPGSEVFAAALNEWGHLSEDGRRAVLETLIRRITVRRGKGHTVELRRAKYQIIPWWQPDPDEPEDGASRAIS